jgi:hypothetical protein
MINSLAQVSFFVGAWVVVLVWQMGADGVGLALGLLASPLHQSQIE